MGGRRRELTNGIAWSEVAARLDDAHLYWMHTTDPGGSPDAVPVWGAVVDEVLYIYTYRSSVKARNLARDRRTVVHLESGSEVTIVHGFAVDIGMPSAHPAVMEAFAAKYDEPWEVQFLPSSDPSFDVLYSVEPRRALVWSLPDSEASMRRWSSQPTE